MAGLIDTNLLLYAANRDTPEHSRAKAFLESVAVSADTWYLTEGIAYEFLRVATHSKVFHEPLNWDEALGFLEVLMGWDNLRVLESGKLHWQTLREILGKLRYPSGNLFFDLRTASLMMEHGLKRIYTADTDFLQIAGLVVVNPLNEHETEE